MSSPPLATPSRANYGIRLAAWDGNFPRWDLRRRYPRKAGLRHALAAVVLIAAVFSAGPQGLSQGLAPGFPHSRKGHGFAKTYAAAEGCAASAARLRPFRIVHACAGSPRIIAARQRDGLNSAAPYELGWSRRGHGKRQSAARPLAKSSCVSPIGKHSWCSEMTSSLQNSLRPMQMTLSGRAHLLHKSAAMGCKCSHAAAICVEGKARIALV
jgi:hypothetical protein